MALRRQDLPSMVWRSLLTTYLLLLCDAAAVKFNANCRPSNCSQDRRYPLDSYFDCSIGMLLEWEEFQNTYQVLESYEQNRSKIWDMNPPSISAVGFYLITDQNNVKNNPNLNITFRLPRGNAYDTKALLVKFIGTDDPRYPELIDPYYKDNPRHRLFNFPLYKTPEQDKIHPREIVYGCFMGLDCQAEKRVYLITLTAYTMNRAYPGASITYHFTVYTTRYVTKSSKVTIAVAPMYRQRAIHVVFEPVSENHASRHTYYNVQLMEIGTHKLQTVEIGHESSRYEHEFPNVNKGSYIVEVEVRNCAGINPCPVSQSGIVEVEYQSVLPLGNVLGLSTAISNNIHSLSTPPANSNDTDLDLPTGILVIGCGVATAIILLILLYRQRNNGGFFKSLCQLSTNRQESRKKSLLLYVREAEKFVPCIRDFLNDKLSSMEVVCDLDWEKDQTRPFDLFQRNVKQCSHLLVLWSPSASAIMSNPSTPGSIEINPHSTVQDYFKEAITFSKDLSTTDNLKIVVLYIPGYADSNTVSENIGEHKMFDLTLECKQFCKYLTGDKSEFNKVPDNALQQQITKILNPLQEVQEDKVEVVDEPCPDIPENRSETNVDLPCPVHPYAFPQNTQYSNISLVSHAIYRQNLTEQWQGYNDSDHHYPPHTLTDDLQSQHTLTCNHHPHHTLVDDCHPPYTLADDRHPPYTLSDDRHSPYTLADERHPPYTLADDRHPHQPLADDRHPHHTQADDHHAPYTLTDDHHPQHTLTYNDNGSCYVHHESYARETNITQDPSPMAPLLNPQPDIDTYQDQGYETKPSMEHQDKFFKLCASL